MFVVDEAGEGLSGSTTTALPRRGAPLGNPGATILHNLICSKAVPEVVREHGGAAGPDRVGHSFIKQVMAETGAVFGGEHSAHYYFARNFNADSGLIASLMVMDEAGRAAQPLSVVRKPLERYSSSGEINTQVDDADGRDRADQRRVRRYAPGPPRRADRRLRLVVVQPASVEHRAAAAAEPRSRDRTACDDRVAELLALITS